MTLDIRIGQPIAAGAYELAVFVVLLGYLIRHRLLPRPRFDLGVVAPWQVFRSEFWEQRGLRSRGGMVGAFVRIVIVLTLLFFVLDWIF